MDLTTPQPSPHQRPTWEQAWEQIGSPDLLTAKALIEISPALRRDAEQWVAWSDTDGDRVADFDDEAWLADVDAQGRGWSSGESRLFAVVASLLDPDRSVRLRGVLDRMGSWETDVWRILVQWGTGGDNRDHPGRCTVIEL